MQRQPAVLLARLSLAIGFVFLAIPPLAKWYMSDYDRYIRLISGPWPFSHFGSAPIQLFYLGLLPLTLGLTLMIFAGTVWWRLRRTAAGASLSLPHILFTLLIAMVSSLMAGVVLMALIARLSSDVAGATVVSSGLVSSDHQRYYLVYDGVATLYYAADGSVKAECKWLETAQGACFTLPNEIRTDFSRTYERGSFTDEYHVPF